MKREEILLALKDIFKEITPEIKFDEIKKEKPFREEVEIDSLDFYRIIVRIHRRLGVYIPDSKLENFLSLDDLVNFISGQPILHQPPVPGP